MKNKAFTLMEVIVIIVIIGILAVLSINPFWARFMERHRALEAEANLILIYNAQKRFRQQQNPPTSFFICPPATCRTRDIQAALDVLLTSNYFTYSIEQTAPAASHYRAAAIRKSGTCAGRRLTVDDQSSRVNDAEGCDRWRGM